MYTMYIDRIGLLNRFKDFKIEINDRFIVLKQFNGIEVIDKELMNSINIVNGIEFDLNSNPKLFNKAYCKRTIYNKDNTKKSMDIVIDFKNNEIIEN